MGEPNILSWRYYIECPGPFLIGSFYILMGGSHEFQEATDCQSIDGMARIVDDDDPSLVSVKRLQPRLGGAVVNLGDATTSLVSWSDAFTIIPNQV